MMHAGAIVLFGDGRKLIKEKKQGWGGTMGPPLAALARARGIGVNRVNQKADFEYASLVRKLTFIGQISSHQV